MMQWYPSEASSPDPAASLPHLLLLLLGTFLGVRACSLA